MASELKSAASRANGAKSGGPKSPETREKSSRNSVTHGFTAKNTVVLSCENPEQFQRMLDDYAGAYQPASPVEEDLVGEMVAARWRTYRLRMIETALLDGEIKRQPPPDGFGPSAEPGATPPDPGYRVANAFRRLVDESHAISLASRYESRLHRIHERCHRTLRELQQARKERQAAEPAPPPPVKPQPATASVDKKKLRNEPEISPSTPDPAVPTSPVRLLEVA